MWFFDGQVVVNCVAKVDCRRTVFRGCGFRSLGKYFFAEGFGMICPAFVGFDYQQLEKDKYRDPSLRSG